MMRFVLKSVENIAGKGENAGYYQHFFIFLQCFQMVPSLGLLRLGIVLYRVKRHCMGFVLQKLMTAQLRVKIRLKICAG